MVDKEGLEMGGKMEERFKDVEAVFERIKTKFRSGEISQQEFVDNLKQLRIKDDQGRFWMIGARTGQWYVFDGKDWSLSTPPSFKDKKAICIYCGGENDIEAEVCSSCGGRVSEEEEPAGKDISPCPVCGSLLDPEFGTCLSCAPKEATAAVEQPVDSSDAYPFVIKSVHPLSYLLFLGGLGIVCGVVAGLLAGATELFPELNAALPSFFKDLQGKIAGGVVFAALGGVFGFIVFSALGAALAFVINAVLYFTGGVRFRGESGGKTGGGLS